MSPPPPFCNPAIFTLRTYLPYHLISLFLGLDGGAIPLLRLLPSFCFSFPSRISTCYLNRWLLPFHFFVDTRFFVTIPVLGSGAIFPPATSIFSFPPPYKFPPDSGASRCLASHFQLAREISCLRFFTPPLWFPRVAQSASVLRVPLLSETLISTASPPTPVPSFHFFVFFYGISCQRTFFAKKEALILSQAFGPWFR